MRPPPSVRSTTRRLAKHQREGVLIHLDGAPVELDQVVVDQLGASRFAAVAIEAVSGAVILDQARRRPRSVVAGFGRGVKRLTGTTIRAAGAAAQARVRLVGR